MHSSRALAVPFLLVVVLSLVPLAGGAQVATPSSGELPAGVEVVASGLTNPRGFTWDAEGNLYLALAGAGGPNQVVADGTPYPFFGGLTSSIVQVDDGCTVPVVEDIASYLWTDPGWIWGAMDLATFEGQLYALLGGGGADVGMPDNPNGVYRVDADGSLELIADLSAWFRENPTVFTPWDYGADGSLFDLEAGRDRLWVSEAVGGRLLSVTPDGEITQIADLSEDHMVPTGVAPAPDGGAYVNHETVVPFPDGAATVIHVALDGTVTDAWTGLTAGTDLVMGPDDVLYAVEMATGNSDEPPYLNPGTGRVVRQTGPDSLEPVVVDADYPVYLGFGPDDALYLTYPAFGPDAGEGQGALLRLDVSGDRPISLAGLGELAPSCGGEASAAAPVADTGATASVTIADFAFSPPELAVAAGETVTWVNHDWAPHTATAGDGGFDSGRLDEGASFGYTFAEPGTYAYACAYHPGMTGSIVVE
ncbi:MAG: ScyD/ScyE family protein [Chloroflexota bacterium]|nr:ScyD/ScyE family protein [Chloroflexota bacterium]